MKKYFFIIVCVFILVLGVAVYVEYTSNEIQKIQEGIGQDKINNSSVSSNGEKLNQESVTSYAMPIDCGNIIFVENLIKDNSKLEKKYYRIKNNISESQKDLVIDEEL